MVGFAGMGDLLCIRIFAFTYPALPSDEPFSHEVEQSNGSDSQNGNLDVLAVFHYLVVKLLFRYECVKIPA